MKLHTTYVVDLWHEIISTAVVFPIPLPTQVLNIHNLVRVMELGSKNHSVGATLMNVDSSRSHSIFTINIEMMEASTRVYMHSTQISGTVCMHVCVCVCVCAYEREREREREREHEGHQKTLIIVYEGYHKYTYMYKP